MSGWEEDNDSVCFGLPFKKYGVEKTPKMQKVDFFAPMSCHVYGAPFLLLFACHCIASATISISAASVVSEFFLSGCMELQLMTRNTSRSTMSLCWCIAGTVVHVVEMKFTLIRPKVNNYTLAMCQDVFIPWVWLLFCQLHFCR